MHGWHVTPWILAFVAGAALSVSLDAAAPPTSPQSQGTITAAPIAESVWLKTPKKAITSTEIDELLNATLKKGGIETTTVCSDEVFIRRAYLDLWGKPPAYDELTKFVADKDSQKRAKLIDKLLAGDTFARNYARYWRDVMSSNLVTNIQSQQLGRHFDIWMTAQLKSNTSWATITREMLTASGEAKFDDTEGKAGRAWFLGAHMGADAVTEQAAETARVFLGIQINCAQCHDHPFDLWKREQFHELAAYFARVRPRLMRDPDSERVRFTGVNLASVDRGGFGMGFGGGPKGGFGGGEYRMPDTNNPRAGGKVIHPKPLLGKTPERGLKDADRRKALADSIVSKDNYWFSAAFVNRTWGILLGQSFYQPSDDLGPQREAVHGETLARLSASFADSNHDIKQLFRVIMNTQAYQRESRIGATRADHLYFAASYPVRLRPGALHESLVNTLGSLDGGGFGGKGPRMGMGFGPFGGGGIEGMIRSEFGFNPSLKNDDVESSIPQSLILMNNPQISDKIKARGNNVLAKILSEHKDNKAALEVVYLRALCRKPTTEELKKCESYLAKLNSRSEAFEDILWALINSTEFQTRR